MKILLNILFPHKLARWLLANGIRTWGIFNALMLVFALVPMVASWQGISVAYMPFHDVRLFVFFGTLAAAIGSFVVAIKHGMRIRMIGGISLLAGSFFWTTLSSMYFIQSPPFFYVSFLAIPMAFFNYIFGITLCDDAKATFTQ